jgi:hypothetical protein
MQRATHWFFGSDAHPRPLRKKNITQRSRFARVSISNPGSSMIRSALIPIFLLLAPLTSHADTRPWKSADGQRTIQGEFVSRDASQVTIRTQDGRQVAIELSLLHADDQQWLEIHHSLKKPGTASIPDPAAVFDTLTFSDNRESALAKLKASKIVEMTTDETFIGRSGLNGVFRTRQKIGDLSGFLYFDWTEAGKLKEITLQTEGLEADAYKSSLEPSWKEFVDLLNTLYGKPVQKGPIPSKESLADGSFSPSHLWKLEAGGSALLGTAREGNRYLLVVRFTQKAIKPVQIP